MERVINDLFVITDEEIVKEEIWRFAEVDPDMDEVTDYILKNADCITFFDKDLNIKDEKDYETLYCWLDTGIKTEKNESLMISMLKRDGYFSGYYVGTPQYLVNGLCRKNPYQERKLRANLSKFQEKNAKAYEANAVDSVSNVEKADCMEIESTRKRFCGAEERFTNVTEALYGALLVPSFSSIKGLDRFIKIIGTRVKQLVNNNLEQYFVINNIKSVIVNTGMMNLFGKDVLVLYRYFEKYQTYIAETVISSKQDFLQNGFTKEQASMEIEPICFFDEGEDIFNPTIEDFDINQDCLMHIIQERRERFPESIREQSDSRIATQLIAALERGVKMQNRDHFYAKPSYSGKSGQISWYMPLHIDAPLSEKPELVMAIRKHGDFYEVKTILPFDAELEDRIVALSLYSRLWN